MHPGWQGDGRVKSFGEGGMVANGFILLGDGGSVEMVVLLGVEGDRYPVPLGQGVAKVARLGVVNTDGLDLKIGRRVEVAGRIFLVLRPTLREQLMVLQRKAQIILPKDSFRLALECNLQSGSTVVEGGAGSGAMTLVLLHTVAPTGRVVTYEVREDMTKVARGNVVRSGWAHLWTPRAQDIRAGIQEEGVDAVVLDIPDPWEVVPHAHRALAPCGTLASYSPTMEQARETVLALRKFPFVDIRTLEILERHLEIGQGTRPAFEMFGHTGYITLATRVSESIEGPQTP